jgi:hypothetical protein
MCSQLLVCPTETNARHESREKGPINTIGFIYSENEIRKKR